MVRARWSITLAALAMTTSLSGCGAAAGHEVSGQLRLVIPHYGGGINKPAAGRITFYGPTSSIVTAGQDGTFRVRLQPGTYRVGVRYASQPDSAECGAGLLVVGRRDRTARVACVWS